MSRAAQDTLAMLRGLQLVAKASATTHEQYLKHLWANSSVRDLVEQNVKNANQCTKKFRQNPQKELETILKTVQETAERSSVVVEGLRQYAAVNFDNTKVSSNQTNSKLDSEVDENTDSNTINNFTNFDLSAITLKELQALLKQPNPDALIKTKPKVPEVTANQKKPEKIGTTIMKDEKYVDDWMKFIAKHDPKSSSSTEAIVENKNVKIPTPLKTSINLPQLSTVAKQRTVPSSRIGRMASFGTLFAGLGVGTVNQLVKGSLGLGGTTNVKEALFSSANANRIVDTLCKVRGAALKIGQILSIQDSSLVSPEMVKAFDRVRQAADYMPDWQVEKCMSSEIGKDWRSNLRKFEDKPFAAASIGQVHRAELNDGTEVAIKIQYPGVAKSIGSDIDNLVGMLKVWDVFPKGFFIDNIVKVAKRELVWEVDYIREAEYTEKFGEMIAPYKEYRVPKVIKELTTKSVITTELVPGIPLDKCFELR